MKNDASNNTIIITQQGKEQIQSMEILYNYETTRTALTQLLYLTELKTPKEEFEGNMKVAQEYINSMKKQRSKIA